MADEEEAPSRLFRDISPRHHTVRVRLSLSSRERVLHVVEAAEEERTPFPHHLPSLTQEGAVASFRDSREKKRKSS